MAPVVGISSFTHGALLVAALGGLLGDARDPAGAPDLTYLAIAEPDLPAEPTAVVEPEPAEPEVAKAPAFLPPEPDGTRADAEAGFQELRPPEEVAGIPPETRTDSVRAEDFRGRGVAGGVADGVRPDGPVARTASELGHGDANGAGAGGAGRGAIVDEAFVTQPPELLERAQVGALLLRLYPRMLVDMQVGGTVLAEFVVDTSGRVDPGSVRILSSPHPLLEAATRTALGRFRFEPGRMLWQGEMQAVAVRTRLPINWSVR